MAKQVYKKLTSAQSRKALSLAKKGVSQQKIAKSLGIAKQSVATHLRAKKVGKRAAGTFWQDVKSYQRLEGLTWVEARKRAYNTVFWGEKRAKRAGKEFQTWQDFWDDQKEKYKKLSEEEQKEALAEDMEEKYLVSV